MASFNSYLQYFKDHPKNYRNTIQHNGLVRSFKSLPEDMRLEIWKNLDALSKERAFRGLPDDYKLEAWGSLDPILQKNTFQDLSENDRENVWGQLDSEVKGATIQFVASERGQWSRNEAWKKWLSLDEKGRVASFKFFCKLFAAEQAACWRQLSPKEKGESLAGVYNPSYSVIKNSSLKLAYDSLDEYCKKRYFLVLPLELQLSVWETLKQEQRDKYADSLFNRVVLSQVTRLRKAFDEVSPEKRERLLHGLLGRYVREAFAID